MPTGGQNSAQEFVAIDGIVASGVNGVAVAPTNATGALDNTWVDHGLTTAAGVTRSEPRSATVRRAWQKNTKMRTLVTDASVRFVFILTQTNQKGIELFHGVSLVAGSLITDPSRDWPLIAFDFDSIDGANVVREYAPRARVVEVGDRVSVAGDTFGYPITVEAEYDSALGGYTRLFYSEFETVAVPVLTSALPSGVAVGGWIEVIGTGLSSTVSLTIGGVNVPTFSILSATRLLIKVPAGSAGSAPIIVTNTGGASSPLAYTRGV